MTNEMAYHKNARKLLRPKIKSEDRETENGKRKTKYQMRPGLIDKTQGTQNEYDKM